MLLSNFLRANTEEIDLIVDKKTSKELIEIKHSSTMKSKMLSTIEKYLEKNDTGILLYNSKNFPYKKNVKIINYKDYLAQV